MKKIAVILIIFFCFLTIRVNAYQINADIKTERIPAGIKLELEMASDITSFGANSGDMISAYLTRDVRTIDTVVLPQGTIVRGNISRVINPKLPYRPGVLYFTFDHIVAPNGVQIPIQAGISGELNLDETGGVKGGVNYFGKLKQNANKSGSIIKKAVNWGINSGEDWFKGGKYLVTPFSSIAGTIGGAGYLAGVSVIDLFKKGSEVKIEKGKIFTITLIEPLDVPVYE